MPAFDLTAPYSPKGDQPTAIAQLVEGVNGGERYQTLLGATGTGKTFTMANVIAQTGRPALVLAHNNTLAAQLCNEMRECIPANAVAYINSYYDYARPQATVPRSATSTAKTASSKDHSDMRSAHPPRCHTTRFSYDFCKLSSPHVKTYRSTHSMFFLLIHTKIGNHNSIIYFILRLFSCFVNNRFITLSMNHNLPFTFS